MMMNKKYIIAVLGMFLLVTLAACNRAGDMESPDWDTSDYVDAAPAAELPLTGGGRPVQQAPTEAENIAEEIPPDINEPSPINVDVLQRMVIRNADMRLQTLYFDETVSNIETLILNRGGFIESASLWREPSRGVLQWRGDFTLRVPVGLFDTVNRELMDLGRVSYFSTQSHDATREFHDLQSRIRIRQEELRRVEHMRDLATDLNAIIDLEQRLTQTRLALDTYTRRREEIDQLASFSTIRLTVHEVIEIVETMYYPPQDGFGTRVGRAFNASVNFTLRALDFVAIVISAVIVPAVLLVLFVFIVNVIFKKRQGLVPGYSKLANWLNV